MAIIKIKNPAIDLDAAEIPNLPASKITSGTFADARIADLSASKLTGSISDARLPANALNSNVDLTNLSASNLTSGTIPTARITALPAGVGGKVLQVVTATDSTSRTTTSTSYVTASNTLLVNITPSSTSSKIFVTSSFTVSAPSDTWAGHFTIFRDTTNLASDKFINAHGTSTYQVEGAAISVLDSPNTTSATTYQVYLKVQSSSYPTTIIHGGSKGTITAFEIGA
jgi:hypothetical protein